MIKNFHVNDDKRIFDDKLNELTFTCDNLLKCLKSNETNDKKWTKNIQPIDSIKQDETSIEASTDTVASSTQIIDLKTENSKIKHQLFDVENNLIKIENENSYLKWENEQLEIELNILKNQLKEDNIIKNELKAEIKCLQINQEQINDMHYIKLKDELSTTKNFYTTKEEYLKRKIYDLEKQLDIKDDPIRNKINCLEDELLEKNNSIKILNQKISQLIKDNNKLHYDHQKYKLQKEDELELLYSRETELEAHVSLLNEKGFKLDGSEEIDDELSNKTFSLIQEKTIQKFLFQKDIENLTRKIEFYEKQFGKTSIDMVDNEAIGKDEEIVDVNESLFDEIKKLKEHLNLEQEQRKNLTIILKEMTTDMKHLLKTTKDIV